MHCLKIFQERYCSLWSIYNSQHQSGSMVTHGTKHKVVFLEGEKRSTGDICAHILTGKVIEMLVKQHIGLLCNMEASNIPDQIINIPIYLMKIKLSMTITGSFSRCAFSDLATMMHSSLDGQLLVVFQRMRCWFFVKSLARALVSPHVPALAEGL